MTKTQAIKNSVNEGIVRRTAQRYVNRQLNGKALKEKSNVKKKSQMPVVHLPEQLLQGRN